MRSEKHYRDAIEHGEAVLRYRTAARPLFRPVNWPEAHYPQVVHCLNEMTANGTPPLNFTSHLWGSPHSLSYPLTNFRSFTVPAAHTRIIRSRDPIAGAGILNLL